MGLFDQDIQKDTTPELAPNDMPDGVYFSMPEKAYHSLPRLSASGMKDIIISIPTFWARSWMNPDREDNDDDTNAKILGRAYHVAIFEPETMASRYVSKPDWTKFPNLLTSDTAVKAELKAMGMTQTKSGESTTDRAHRLIDGGFEGNIKSIIEAEFYEDLDGRTAIDHRYFKQINQDIDRIRDNPEIYDMVTGGASEVSILWTCPDTGIRMKARIDKLKRNCFVDLKSFTNTKGKPVNQAVYDQVQYYRYYLSMRLYQVAISMIAKLDLQIMDKPNDAQLMDDRSFPPQHHVDLIMELKARRSPLQPWFFFQEKDGVPNLLVRKLGLQQHPEGVDEQSIGAEQHDIKMSDSVICRKADLEIDYAKRMFLDAFELYGADGNPWLPFDMIGEISDRHFSQYFLDTIA